MITAYFLLVSRANKYSRTNFNFEFRRMKITNGSEKKLYINILISLSVIFKDVKYS